MRDIDINAVLHPARTQPRETMVEFAWLRPCRIKRQQSMWANSTSPLKADPTEDTGPRTVPDDLVSTGGSAAVGVNGSRGGIGRLRWNPDAIRRLDQDIEWALTSNPTGAAEVAGLLLGKIGSPMEITDFKPVFLMQPRDRAYALAGPGRKEFERTIAALQSIPEDQRSVIGFYRSDTDGGQDLTEEDLGLLRACFRDITSVVLLIQRTADGSSGFKLFSGDQGEVLRRVHSSESASGLEGVAALPRWLELWHGLSGDNAPTGTNAATLARATELAETKPEDAVPEYTPILAARAGAAELCFTRPALKAQPGTSARSGTPPGYSHELPDFEGFSARPAGRRQSRSGGSRRQIRHLSSARISTAGREAGR